MSVKVVKVTDSTAVRTVVVTTGGRGPGGIDTEHRALAAPHTGHETPAGAQAKVDAFEATANATYSAIPDTVRKVKEVHGGQFPRPIRAPHLVIDEAYPSDISDIRVVWAEGDVRYGFGSEFSFYKSTDAGRSWVQQASNQPYSIKGQFLKLANGNLLAWRTNTAPSTPGRIYRSIDDGLTWAEVHTFRFYDSTELLGVQSWCEDSNGDVYYVEYTTDATRADVAVFRSTDGGASFSIFHLFPGPGTSDPDRIRHLHSAQYDPGTDRVYFLAGDAEAAAGIYRTNAARTGIEEVVRNSQIADLGSAVDYARGIGLMFFPTHMAWPVDGADAWLMRMTYDQIGVAAPVVEKVYKLNSTGWFTCKASADGSRWVFSASQEAVADRIDDSVHLYAVEDNGATVYELGAVPTTGAGFGALAPVGKPEMHGDRFWLRAHAVRDPGGHVMASAFRGRLAYGARPLIIAPQVPHPPRVLAWQTVSVPRTVITGADYIVMGGTRAASTKRRLVIFDTGLRRLGGDGFGRIEVVNLTTSTVLWSTTAASNRANERSASLHDGAPWLASFDVATSTDIEFRFVAHTASGFDGWAHLTFGWATIPGTPLT